MSLGQKIKSLRISKNLSQDRFGKRIGISGKTVSAYECGRAKPPLKVLESITDIYGHSFLHITGKGKSELYDKIKNIRHQLSEIEVMIVEYK